MLEAIIKQGAKVKFVHFIYQMQGKMKLYFKWRELLFTKPAEVAKNLLNKIIKILATKKGVLNSYF